MEALLGSSFKGTNFMEFRKMIRPFCLMIGLLLCPTVSIASCPTAIHSTSLTAFTLSPDGARIAGVANDGTVFWWDVKSGNRTILVECLYASAINFSPNSSQVALGDSHGTVRIFDLLSGREVQSLGTNTTRANSESGAQMQSIDQVVFSADGSCLASHDLNGIHVWALSEGKELLSISDDRRVEQIALNRNGTLLARGGYGWLALWDIARIQAVKVFPLQPGDSVDALIFSRDDRWIISAQSRQEIDVWDTKTGNKVKTLHGQTGHVDFPLIAVGTEALFSAASDGTLRLWDLETGQLKSVWQKLPGFISGDGRFLLSSTAQPGQLELRGIGDSAKEARSFIYKSPLCTENLSAERHSSATKQREALQHVGMGESTAGDGTHLSFTVYVMPDCTTVTITHGDFTTEQNAVRELNRQVTAASAVAEQGPHKDFFGQTLGQRAVISLNATSNAAGAAAVIWTEANHYNEIRSSSLEVALSLEKRYRGR